MGGKINAFLLDSPEGCQGENLEAAGVRQDGPIPVHELVEAPHLPDEPVTGPEVEVVGVAQLDLAADLPEVERVHAPLDGGLGAHVHEHRGLDHAAVGTGKLAAPGAALGFK